MPQHAGHTRPRGEVDQTTCNVLSLKKKKHRCCCVRDDHRQRTARQSWRARERHAARFYLAPCPPFPPPPSSPAHPCFPSARHTLPFAPRFSCSSDANWVFSSEWKYGCSSACKFGWEPKMNVEQRVLPTHPPYPSIRASVAWMRLAGSKCSMLAMRSMPSASSSGMTRARSCGCAHGTGSDSAAARGRAGRRRAPSTVGTRASHAAWTRPATPPHWACPAA